MASVSLEKIISDRASQVEVSENLSKEFDAAKKAYEGNNKEG